MIKRITVTGKQKVGVINLFNSFMINLCGNVVFSFLNAVVDIFPRFSVVFVFSRRLSNAVAPLKFSRAFVGRGGDDQAKLRNPVINDERPFVWNERKTYFTTGRNRGAEMRQA